tara:strand:+ start:368 stop:1222 length:855 start_codon:yes stop_codon:yes gene_type:complete
MRPSFLRLLRLGLLQDLTQKRLKFILNIAIFLSVFAIVSTLISISIERKINLNQKKISENNLLIDIASLSIESLPRNINSLTTIINDSKKNNEIMFFLYFTESGIIFNERDLYFLGTARLANLIEDNYEKINMFSDISSFETDIEINDDYKNYLKLREEIKDDKKKFTEVYEKIKQDAKKFTIDQNGIQVIEGDEFYKGLKEHYYQFLKFADNQIDIQIDLLNVLRSLTDKKKNQNIDIRKDISNLSKSISKYILIAFFLQLIIFIIVQLFEVYTTKKEIDEKR